MANDKTIQEQVKRKGETMDKETEHFLSFIVLIFLIISLFILRAMFICNTINIHSSTCIYNVILGV
jgi:hypothetical protein